MVLETMDRVVHNVDALSRFLCMNRVRNLRWFRISRPQSKGQKHTMIPPSWLESKTRDDSYPNMDFFLGVLAGGKSTRFGSNKCLYKMEGRTLISIILSEVPLLKQQPNAVFISLFGEDQVPQFLSHLPQDQIKSYQDEGHFYLQPHGDQKVMAIPVTFVFDAVKRDLLDIRAAIIGLASLLNEIPAGAYMQVIPCDTPFFNAKVMDAIHGKLGEVAGQVDALVPRWRNGYIEPLHTIYKKEMVEKIKENLAKKVFKLSSLFDGGIRVAFFDIETSLGLIDPDMRAFKNFNSPGFLAGKPDSIGV